MPYRAIYKNGAVCLPAAALDLCEDVRELKLLMLLSYDRTLEEADESRLAETLGCTPEELRRTVSALRASGLLETEKKPSPSSAARNLTGEEIADLVAGDASLRPLIGECQALCGKVLTPTDISRVVSLRKELGYDGETILLLFCYYHEKLEAVGRTLSVSYVEKAAYGLYNQGIRTSEQLQDYIRETEKKNSLAFRFRRLFGMGDRKATKKEERFFGKWTAEWDMPFELIEYAYEIAVDNTGAPSLDYISKILSDWHEKGIKSVPEAEKENAERRTASPYHKKFKEKPSEQPLSSFDTDEFFEKALRRSYAVMNGGKEE